MMTMIGGGSRLRCFLFLVLTVSSSSPVSAHSSPLPDGGGGAAASFDGSSPSTASSRLNADGDVETTVDFTKSASEQMLPPSSAQPEAPPSFSTGGEPSSSSSELPSELRSTNDAATTTAAVVTPPGQLSTRRKLDNVKERALPAVILLAGLYAVVHFGKDLGLAVLFLAATPGLYHEAVAVLWENDSNNSRNTDSATTSIASLSNNPWWWFAAASLGLTVPRVVAMAVEGNSNHKITTYSHLASYSLVVIGFMDTIVRLHRECAMAGPSDSVVSVLRTAWTRLAVYVTSAVCTVVPIALALGVIQCFGRAWMLYTALLVILNDTLAYAFGYTWGKHPILPTISPKKTWEGFSGALVSTMLLSRPVWRLLFRSSSVTSSSDAVAAALPYHVHSVVLALFCCLVAPFGGFMASAIKRAGGKKDFGNLMPGHGGLIDRLDCQLLAAPFLYLYLAAVVGVPSSTALPAAKTAIPTL